MLRELHIRDLGVIEDATLTLDPGLTVVTGETGAGKTMVVTGLGLVLGGRADAGLVRSGSDEAVVEAELELDADHPARRTAEEAGGEGEYDPHPGEGRPVDKTGVTVQEAAGTSAARPPSKREPAGQPADAKDTE